MELRLEVHLKARFWWESRVLVVVVVVVAASSTTVLQCTFRFSFFLCSRSREKKKQQQQKWHSWVTILALASVLEILQRTHRTLLQSASCIPRNRHKTPDVRVQHARTSVIMESVFLLPECLTKLWNVEYM
jgi:hypothetical protein